MKITDPSLLALMLSVGIVTSSPVHAQRHYRDYYPPRPYPPRTERVAYNYHQRYVIPYRGYSYYYYDGLFYQNSGAYFQFVAPPIGIHVTVLPRGYRPIHFGGDVFFYSNGIFYRRDANDYEVVRAPIGAELPEIPRGAKVIVIDDEKYYEYNGTYFKERVRQDGEIWYEVVGKNGRLQTDTAVEDVRLGMMVSTLPSGCKVVIINNQKYYVSPDQVYYQEVIENNQLYYKVTGMPQERQR